MARVKRQAVVPDVTVRDLLVAWCEQRLARTPELIEVDGGGCFVNPAGLMLRALRAGEPVIFYGFNVGRETCKSLGLDGRKRYRVEADGRVAPEVFVDRFDARPEAVETDAAPRRRTSRQASARRWGASA